jgi:hypothetical protein
MLISPDRVPIKAFAFENPYGGSTRGHLRKELPLTC